MSNLGILLRRYSVSFGFAAGVTGALLVLMEQLIRPEFAEVEPAPPPIKFDIHPIIDEPEPPIKEPPAPPPPVEPPPMVAVVPTADNSDPTWSFDPIDPGPVETKISPRTGQADGDLISLALVTPNYPARARSKGIEGYVVVEFTVDVTGAVRNARVVESEPGTIFDRAAVLSIERSKYKPRREGGKALVVHGVRKRVSFNLES